MYPLPAALSWRICHYLHRRHRLPLRVVPFVIARAQPLLSNRSFHPLLFQQRFFFFFSFFFFLFLFDFFLFVFVVAAVARLFCAEKFSTETSR